MDVKLRRALPGCLGIPLSIMTLGIFPLMLGNIERNYFSDTVDDEGLVTRGGKRILWTEFTKV